MVNRGGVEFKLWDLSLLGAVYYLKLKGRGKEAVNLQVGVTRCLD